MGQYKLLLIILIFSFQSCINAQADNNTSLGQSCSEFGNSSFLSASYKSHLSTLLDSLEKSVTAHNGFYKTSVSNDVYGLIQCRADVSTSNCANCTTNSINIARNECPNSKTATIFARWCFLRYEDKDFTGKELDEGSSMGTSNEELDETAVIAKGETLMGEIARNTSSEPMMYKVGVVDVGSAGKRYGMAECNRDMTRMDCGKCLDGLLTGLWTLLNKRGWEMYTSGCRMWYDDYQFYSNNFVSNPSLVSSAQADPNNIIVSSCAEFGNSTSHPLPDTYKSHVLTLLDNLSKFVTTHNGFYKTSVSNNVYGLIKCRADVYPSNCNSNSFYIALKECPNSKTATIFARWCFLK
ncbi:cysteine-rich repeat secretory protein 38-like [Impatiens glandulifera]|uniref:cysteine-rich repeat secretory protein 38-like n=1 Tax=Impatiens glandulifera TaxID=253017 RepID=UPI001FB145FF|nr:cysteine-rich repeat secretory protein 38-like [Impatiens glandulifera]